MPTLLESYLDQNAANQRETLGNYGILGQQVALQHGLLGIAAAKQEADAKQRLLEAQGRIAADPRFAPYADLIAAGQFGHVLDSVMPKPKAPEPFTLKPGDTRYGADGKPIVAVPAAPKDDDFSRALEMAGIKQGAPEYTRLLNERLAKLTQHPPAPNVQVRVDQKTGESLAKPIGEMVSESRNAALGALEQLDASQRVRGAIASGKVNVGPGASLRNATDQIAETLGVGGKDTTERLQNTRNVVKGLAEFTLGARKQLKGQGSVSDFEGKLIEKAASGDIDSMTLPEIKTLLDVSDRLARKQHELHERNLSSMRNQKDLQALVPFYEVPPLPAAAPQGSVIRYDANGRRIQ